MIRNYISITVRQLIRHPAYAIICIVGLSIGLAIGMMSVSYMVREFSWEKCHTNHDRIYRVEMGYHHADTTWSSARVMAPLGDAIVENIPGVEGLAVFHHVSEVTLQIEQTKYRAGNLIFARPEFFDVFTFPALDGNPKELLARPNTVFITDSIAQAYYPSENPIGQTITLNNSYELIIGGILQNLSPFTQLHCDFVASYATLNSEALDEASWTGGRFDLTYLLLDESADPEFIAARIPDVFSRHVSSDLSGRHSFSLKPLNDIYFDTYYSGNRGEIWPGFEYDVMFIVLGVALFILIQSMVNFINLSTARAADRMKEVGLRKTFGAARSQLFNQFLGESIIITLAATAIGLSLFEFFRNGYQTITPDRYPLPGLYGSVETVLFTLTLVLLVALLAGAYPAVYLSRFKPVSILSQGSSGGPSRSRLRKVLAVIQFTLAIFFIIETIGHYKQLDFLTHYDLGFDRENVMVMRFSSGEASRGDCALAMNELASHNSVVTASRSDFVLGTRVSSEIYFTTPERHETDYKVAKNYEIDHNFLSMFDVEVVAGRGFSPDRPEDIDHSILINESMKKELALDNPIGQLLYTDSSTFEIVGVVEDIQATSLDWAYRAASVFVLSPDSCRVLNLRLQPDDISGSIAAIENTWHRIFGGRIFDYTFLQDDIRARYGELDSIVVFFGTMSVISIIIACLGTFGLVLYTVQRKTKDIAIRKILGASATSILKTLLKDFVWLIVIANLIACPFAYLMLTWAIEYYPFQVNLGPETFLAGGLLLLITVWLTSAYHVSRAARANPSDTLRYE